MQISIFFTKDYLFCFFFGVVQQLQVEECRPLDQLVPTKTSEIPYVQR
jgi:hypothetical protein